MVIGSCLMLPGLAEASHFRYAHYSFSWQPAGGNTIDFALHAGFRRTANPCVDTTTNTTIPCTAPDGQPAVGDVIVEFTGNTTFNAGDGTVFGSPLGPLYFQVTAIDPANNWLVGVALDPNSLPARDPLVTHTYAAPGDYVAFTASCCRLSGSSGHVNNPDGSYRVETLVNVGGANSSPVSALPPIVACQQNSVCTFKVPAADQNGDPITFRLSTSTEAGPGFNQPGPPYAPNSAAIDPTTGIYTWDTTGATVNSTGHTYYSTQVTIEDRTATGGVKSKVAVDFLIELVPFAPGNPPRFDHPPTPPCGSIVNAQAGSTLTFTVQASDPDTGAVVTLNVAGLPPGATMNPSLPTSGNPVSSVFSWTPTNAQVGPYVVTFTATDNTGQQALCSITIVVGLGTTDVSVVKVAADADINAGETAMFTIVVSNAGNNTALNVDLTDVLPPGVAWSEDHPNCTITGPTMACNFGDMAPGATATINLTGGTSVANCAAPLVNTATVTAGNDANPSNNASTAAITVTCLPVLPPLDHFKCYAATVAANHPAAGRNVTLKDQFGSSTATIAKVYDLCNPVDKNNEGINDEEAHLVEYKLINRRSATGRFAKRRVAIENQFGAMTLTVQRPNRLMVPSSKAIAPDKPGDIPENLDHFLCYKVHASSPAFTSRTVSLKDQFLEERATIRKPRMLCNPVSKNREAIQHEDDHLVCYIAKGRARPATRHVVTLNQFGETAFSVRQTRHLCVPSSKREL